MITPGDLAVIVGLNVVGAAAPGPDVILITRTATRSRKHAWATTCGILTGVLLWSTLTVVGAATLLTAFPWALSAVQVIGGAFLLWMAQANIRQGWRDRTTPPVDLDEAEAALGRLRTSYLKGLSTNLANPKIVIALTAMIAPLLPPQPSVATAVIVILSMWASAFALFGVLSHVVSTERVRRRLLAAGPLIDMGSGTFFALVGALLILRAAAQPV
ncbi:LysE family translocator [Corynebacterium mayonis]|uniref:LysE family translocator n=1 Tax=Corynebacterium mayonis TaxID=3062461 RepID=UPI00314042B3